MADPPPSAGPSRQSRPDVSSAIPPSLKHAPVVKGRPRGRGKGKKKATQGAIDADLIDLTFDDDDIETNTPSGPASIRDSIEPEAVPSRIPSFRPSPASGSYTPTAFTPLPRSILSGATIRFSPDFPSPSKLADESSGLTRGMSPVKPQQTLTGDIYIEEVPHDTEKLPGEDSGDHFKPPGLFSTSLMPTVNGEGENPKVELKTSTGALETEGKKQKEADQATNAGLLLPTHVLVESHVPASGGSAGEEVDHEGGVDDEDDSMEGVHFVDDDISKGSRRYFDAEDDEPQELEATFLATADQSKICQNCKRPGHRSKDCKHIICTTCGAEDQHERRDCPVGLVCFGCGTRGHRKQDCPDPNSRNSKRTGCDRCGSWDHMENTCPTIWRVYSYRSADKRRDLQQEKSIAVGWEKEAVGGAASEQWCYNCAREGHLGDDCRERRGSLARLTVPSAFSAEMASRGPFASGSSRSRGRTSLVDTPSTHARWADSDSEAEALPHVSGYKAFGGSHAGRKSREKATAASRAAHEEGSEDEPSWFDNSRGGMSIRGKGGKGNSTPVQRGGRGNKPWDSEYRERDRDRGGRGRSRSPVRRGRNDDRPSPFGHGHLMTSSARDRARNRPPTPSSAPAKVISFGKLSAPGGKARNGDNSGAIDSPSVQSRSSLEERKSGPSSGSMALVNRALGLNGGGNSSTPKGKNKSKEKGEKSPLDASSLSPSPSVSGGESTSSSKKKRRKSRAQHDEKERDWESEWRREGNGGGNVANWGKEIDEEKRGNQNGLNIRGRGAGADGQKGGTPSLLSRLSVTPVPGNGGGPGGGTAGRGKDKGKGKGSTGQRYHGGY